jgi:uncharacterized protein (TIGR00288 family)
LHIGIALKYVDDIINLCWKAVTLGVPILHGEGRVAVLVDCDNATPAMLEYALKVVGRFGRVVLRRGYGNHASLQKKWQDALVRFAFTPCLQYQYAPGKNTADIALALDALEAMCDHWADTFCLVTSDSDFAYLCRKLRERGATVHIVGEAKTPEALRNASDQFFEWRPVPALTNLPGRDVKVAASIGKEELRVATPVKAAVKRRPKSVVDAVTVLAGANPEGKVHLAALDRYLKQADPGFSPDVYGHSGLLAMLTTYELLELKQEEGGHYTVKPKAAGSAEAAAWRWTCR